MSARRQVEIFGRSFERSRTLAATLFAGALALMILGTVVGGPIGTILAAIGATLGTTALVSFLYDPFLKEILAQEIFERVGLRDSIVRAGLIDLSGPTDVNLAERLVGSRRIVVAPLDPFAWARERWNEILEAATKAAASVVVLLPSPDPGPARTLLSKRLDIGESELERKLEALPEDLLKAWDRDDRAADSTLQLFWQDELLSSGLVVCDAVAVIETGPALRQSATDRTGLVQLYERNSPYARWIAEQLDEMIAAGVPAGVRPVTPPGELPGRRAQQALPSGATAGPDAGGRPDAPASASSPATSGTAAARAEQPDRTLAAPPAPEAAKSGDQPDVTGASAAGAAGEPPQVDTGATGLDDARPKGDKGSRAASSPTGETLATEGSADENQEKADGA